jgi:hypothetical protein
MPDATNPVSPTETNEPQAGQVITPNGGQAPAPTPAAVPAPVAEPTPEPAVPAPVSQPEPANEPIFNPEVPEETPVASDTDSVTWTASEYVEHEKNAGWYALLALAAIGIAALVYLLTKDKISAGVVIFGALALGVYGARPPRQLTYQLDSKGLTIGQKQFSYEDFRSFAVVPEGAFSSIVFVHHKRFAPLTTIYFAPAEEDQIVNILTSRLPLEEHRIDAVDQLMRHIRF